MMDVSSEVFIEAEGGYFFAVNKSVHNVKYGKIFEFKFSVLIFGMNLFCILHT